MPRTALALILSGLATAAAAQSIGEPLPRKAAAYETPAKPAARSGPAARPCPEYGAGFMRVEGSSFCVRAGGAVRAEFGKSSRNGYGSRADGLVYLESRGETAFGPVRSVIGVRGKVDRGLDSGPFRR
ncbi:hypothetical protein [Bosea sp. (in: a-proteobacteria)]|uniref:hypothetical protein n=1 Tax=Bosea sp. (in: a-proteobacteria) TaxID=1871050 RepID=UPI00261D89EB|nr:hypothetical protein [Bosea sp. (in: a-proteobacteria)]MCO5092599.1 porin [Bosea sp. (in: a-proteobacteria)]